MNLDTAIAAIIVQLYRDAEAAGVPGQVLFNGQPKSRESITTYIKKQKKDESMTTEEDLLEHLPERCDWPDSVTWDDEGVASVPRQQSHTNGVPHQPEARLAEPLPPRLVPDATYSAQWWWASHPNEMDLPVYEYNNGAFDTIPVPGDDNMLFVNYIEPNHLDRNFHTNPVEPVFENYYPQGSYVQQDPIVQAEALVKLGSFMSSTPVAFRFQGPFDQLNWAQQLAKFIDDMLKSSTEAGNTPSSRFTRHCCEAAIFGGQEEDENGDQLPEFVRRREQAIEAAAQAFQDTLSHEYGQSLNVLNFMRIMLEAFGHGQLAQTIMERLRQTVKPATTHSQSLVAETIEFWIAVSPATWSDEIAEAWVPKLRRVHKACRESATRESQLAIAAEYNLAWALLEANDTETALAILNNGKRFCERAFGRYHLQTISWLTTLARAHLYNQEDDSAEAILDENVSFRVRKAYSEEHPLFWSTRCRQAMYKLRMADKNTQPQRQAELWTTGTQLLREVLLGRARVLGINNPQTRKVFKDLKDYLIMQGKEEEAEDLRNWCMQNIAPYVSHS